MRHATIHVIVNRILADDDVRTQEGEPITVDVLQNDLGNDLILFYAGTARGRCLIVDGQIRHQPQARMHEGQDSSVYMACTLSSPACA